MIGTVTAQYLGYHLRKEVDSLNQLAEQLQNGQVSVTNITPILREAEKQFRLLSKAAELRSM